MSSQTPMSPPKQSAEQPASEDARVAARALNLIHWGGLVYTLCLPIAPLAHIGFDVVAAALILIGTVDLARIPINSAYRKAMRLVRIAAVCLLLQCAWYDVWFVVFSVPEILRVGVFVFATVGVWVFCGAMEHLCRELVVGTLPPSRAPPCRAGTRKMIVDVWKATPEHWHNLGRIWARWAVPAVGLLSLGFWLVFPKDIPGTSEWWQTLAPLNSLASPSLFAFLVTVALATVLGVNLVNVLWRLQRTYAILSCYVLDRSRAGKSRLAARDPVSPSPRVAPSNNHNPPPVQFTLQTLLLWTVVVAMFGMLVHQPSVRCWQFAVVVLTVVGVVALVTQNRKTSVWVLVIVFVLLIGGNLCTVGHHDSVLVAQVVLPEERDRLEEDLTEWFAGKGFRRTWLPVAWQHAVNLSAKEVEASFRGKYYDADVVWALTNFRHDAGGDLVGMSITLVSSGPEFRWLNKQRFAALAELRREVALWCRDRRSRVFREKAENAAVRRQPFSSRERPQPCTP